MIDIRTNRLTLLPKFVLTHTFGWINTEDLLRLRCSSRSHHQANSPRNGDQAAAINSTLIERFRAYHSPESLKIKTIVRKLNMIHRWLRRSRNGCSPHRNSWLLNSRKFVLESIMIQPRFLGRSGWERWMLDREIVTEAVRGGGIYLPYAFRNDVQMVKEYLIANPWRGTYALSQQLLQDRSMVLFALRHGGGIRNLKFEWQDDKEMALAAIENRGFEYRFISDRLKEDIDIIRAFFLSGQSSAYCLSLIPDTIVNDIFIAGIHAKS